MYGLPLEGAKGRARGDGIHLKGVVGRISWKCIVARGGSGMLLLLVRGGARAGV